MTHQAAPFAAGGSKVSAGTRYQSPGSTPRRRSKICAQGTPGRRSQYKYLTNAPEETFSPVWVWISDRSFAWSQPSRSRASQAFRAPSFGTRPSVVRRIGIDMSTVKVLAKGTSVNCLGVE